MLLSFTALLDLAKACYRNIEEYKDGNDKYKLKVHALRHGWLRNTITEILEFEEETEEKLEYKISSKGSGITHVLLLKDPLGRLLDEADSFNDAASVIAHICSLQVACVSNSSSELLRGYEFIRSGLRSITILTSGIKKMLAMAKAKGYNSFGEMQKDKNAPDGEDDGEYRKKLVIKMEEENEENPLKEEKDDRKKAVIKMEEKDNKKNPLKEEEEDFIRLFEQFHITYKGKRFKQMQENNYSDRQEVERERRKSTKN